MTTPAELRVLKALRKLGEGNRNGVAVESGIGSEMAEYLCRYLKEKGLVRVVGRKRGKSRYALTPKGLVSLG